MDSDYYIPGDGCTCSARSEGECGCGVDWRSVREVMLEDFITRLRAHNSYWWQEATDMSDELDELLKTQET